MKNVLSDREKGKHERLRLEINAITSDGAGISRTENGVVFVNGALPGEIVTADLVAKHKDFSVARTLDVEREADGRTEPRCPYYGRCGGCQLQHASYPLQLSLKASIVRDAMTRIGGFPRELFTDLVCEPSPESWGYRNKASFPVQSALHEGEPRSRARMLTGFYRAGTHRIEPIRECPVNATPLNVMYKSVLGGLGDLPITGYDERSGEGKLRHLVMRCGTNTGDSLLSFVINGRLSAKGVKSLIALGSKERPTTVTLNHNSKPGNVILGSYTEALTGGGLITEKLGGRTLAFDTTSFFQVNTLQAERLFACASSLVDGDGGNILELYSGVGSLTCYLAEKGSVTSVEEWRSAVKTAEHNMEVNGFADVVRPLCGRAEDVIDGLDGEAFGTVVMDPPRDGCDRNVLEAVANFGVKNIVYVSCNPATLARDCRILSSRGYELKFIRSFDMFPQTAHVETVAALAR